MSASSPHPADASCGSLGSPFYDSLADGEHSPKAPSSPASVGARGPTGRGRTRGSVSGSLHFSRTHSGLSSTRPGQAATVAEGMESTVTTKRTARKLVRGMVSKNKVRFQEDGFDLDLTYVADRLIAMGFPSTGTEAQYRNPVHQVERFLNLRHPGHYRVYNLCSERKYDTPARFGGHHKHYPFHDHNPPIPFGLFSIFCSDAQSWLEEDPDNVCAVHCKAGKGRTGVMLSALLLTLSHTEAAVEQAETGREVQMTTTAAQALEEFDQARTHDGRGVTIPSQIRYVHYWENVLRRYAGRLPPSRYVRLDSLAVRHPVRGSTTPDIYFTVLQGPSEVGGQMKPLFDSRKHFSLKAVQREPQLLEFDLTKLGPASRFSCTGDVMFKFKARRRLKSDESLFHFWLNVDVEEGGGDIVLNKRQLDKVCKDKRDEGFSADLRVELRFSPGSPAVSGLSGLSGLQAVSPGLGPSPPPVGRFIERSFSVLSGTRSVSPSPASRHRASSSPRAGGHCGQLCFDALSAQGLRVRDAFGLSDPYCVVRCGGEERRTNTAYQTLEPDWSESAANWQLRVEPHCSGIEFEVWSQKKGDTPDAFLGWAQLPFSELLPEDSPRGIGELPSLHRLWYEGVQLMPRPGNRADQRALDKDGGTFGSIHLRAVLDRGDGPDLGSPCASVVLDRSNSSPDSPLAAGSGSPQPSVGERTPIVHFSPDPVPLSQRSTGPGGLRRSSKVGGGWRSRGSSGPLRRATSQESGMALPSPSTSPERMSSPPGGWATPDSASAAAGAGQQACEGLLLVRRLGGEDSPRREAFPAWCRLQRPAEQREPSLQLTAQLEDSWTASFCDRVNTGQGSAELLCYALDKEPSRLPVGREGSHCHSPTSFVVAGYELIADTPADCDRWMRVLRQYGDPVRGCSPLSSPPGHLQRSMLALAGVGIPSAQPLQPTPGGRTPPLAPPCGLGAPRGLNSTSPRAEGGRIAARLPPPPPIAAPSSSRERPQRAAVGPLAAAEAEARSELSAAAAWGAADLTRQLYMQCAAAECRRRRSSVALLQQTLAGAEARSRRDCGAAESSARDRLRDQLHAAPAGASAGGALQRALKQLPPPATSPLSTPTYQVSAPSALGRSLAQAAPLRQRCAALLGKRSDEALRRRGFRRLLRWAMRNRDLGRLGGSARRSRQDRSWVDPAASTELAGALSPSWSQCSRGKAARSGSALGQPLSPPASASQLLRLQLAVAEGRAEACPAPQLAVVPPAAMAISGSQSPPTCRCQRSPPRADAPGTSPTQGRPVRCPSCWLPVAA
eukprot:TRINITY_DN14969_c0_g1_i2.p1 TRINITY_DN14969_c0_g1~~TRINITY_DN14969_c0_g1_i2.p1  ORF type:complete len:1293 (+),score=345.50 TRINITY_DN14969_c0_g1_i2:71-3949(+)